MNYSVHPSIRRLFHPRRFRIFRNGFDRVKVAQLPIEYQKFYTEWMESEEKETPVHWVPKQGKWERNPETGEVKPIQNIPIHVNYPLEMHEGIWGGEGVVQGSVKKGKWRCPVSRFWSPTIQRSILYSEVLDTYLSVVVTQRALRLIDQHHGLDNYLVMTPAYDLKSLLALKLKRIIMTKVLDKDFCKNDPQRQQELLDKYSEYMIPRKELEWYGLSVDEALEKARLLDEAANLAVPLKIQFRTQLINELKRQKENVGMIEESDNSTSTPENWISKLNPFSKRSEAS